MSRFSIWRPKAVSNNERGTCRDRTGDPQIKSTIATFRYRPAIFRLENVHSLSVRNGTNFSC